MATSGSCEGTAIPHDDAIEHLERVVAAEVLVLAAFVRLGGVDHMTRTALVPEIERVTSPEEASASEVRG